MNKKLISILSIACRVSIALLVFELVNLFLLTDSSVGFFERKIDVLPVLCAGLYTVYLVVTSKLFDNLLARKASDSAISTYRIGTLVILTVIMVLLLSLMENVNIYVPGILIICILVIFIAVYYAIMYIKKNEIKEIKEQAKQEISSNSDIVCEKKTNVKLLFIGIATALVINEAIYCKNIIDSCIFMGISVIASVIICWVVCKSYDKAM